MQESIVFLVRVQRRRKESSLSLSHLLMSFLFSITNLKNFEMPVIYFPNCIKTLKFHISN